MDQDSKLGAIRGADTELPSDTVDNAALVTGAVYTVLTGAMTDYSALSLVEVTGINEIRVEVEFMGSPYQLTITQLAQPKTTQSTPRRDRDDGQA